MAYYVCDDCEHYDCNDTNRYDEGWCTYYCRYYPKSDKACSHFERRSDYQSGCFLTTAICNIFGFSDNCIGLETLRYFRDTYLINDVKYHKLLAEYEVIGPKISQKMYNDEHKVEVAGYYFENYLYDIITDFIPNGKNTEAIDKYVEMTNDLKRMYNIEQEVTQNDINSLSNQIKNTTDQEQKQRLTQKRNILHENNRQEISYLIKETKQNQEKTIISVEQNELLTNKIQKIKNTRIICSISSLYILLYSILLNQNSTIILLSGTIALTSLITKIIQKTLSEINKLNFKDINTLITETFYLLYQQQQLNIDYEDYKTLYTISNKVLKEKSTIKEVTTFKDYKTKIKKINTLSDSLATTLDTIEEKYNFNI